MRRGVAHKSCSSPLETSLTLADSLKSPAGNQVLFAGWVASYALKVQPVMVDKMPKRGRGPPLLSCNVFSWLGGHLLLGMTAPLFVPLCYRLHGLMRLSITGASSSPLLPDVSASSMSHACASATSATP